MLPRDHWGSQGQGQGQQQFIRHIRPNGQSPMAGGQVVRGPQDGTSFPPQTPRIRTLLEMQQMVPQMIGGHQAVNQVPESLLRQFQDSSNAVFNLAQHSLQGCGGFQGQMGTTDLGQPRFLSNEERQVLIPNQGQHIPTHQGRRFQSSPGWRGSCLVRIGLEGSCKQSSTPRRFNPRSDWSSPKSSPISSHSQSRTDREPSTQSSKSQRYDSKADWPSPISSHSQRRTDREPSTQSSKPGRYDPKSDWHSPKSSSRSPHSQRKTDRDSCKQSSTPQRYDPKLDWPSPKSLSKSPHSQRRTNREPCKQSSTPRKYDPKSDWPSPKSSSRSPRSQRKTDRDSCKQSSTPQRYDPKLDWPSPKSSHSQRRTDREPRMQSSKPRRYDPKADWPSPKSSSRSLHSQIRTDREPRPNYKHSPGGKPKTTQNLVHVQVQCITDDEVAVKSGRGSTVKQNDSSQDADAAIAVPNVSKSSAPAKRSTCSASVLQTSKKEVISVDMPTNAITNSTNTIGDASSNDKKENRCSKTEDTCNKTEDTCNQTEDTCNKTEDTCSKTEDSCNQTEDTCNKTEDTCSKTEDSCNQTEDTCNKTEDTCNKTEDTCNKTEDTCDQTEEEAKNDSAELDPEDIFEVVEIVHIIEKEGVDMTENGHDNSDERKEIICNKTEATCNQTEDTCNKTEDTCNQTEDTCNHTEDVAKNDSAELDPEDIFEEVENVHITEKEAVDVTEKGQVHSDERKEITCNKTEDTCNATEEEAKNDSAELDPGDIFEEVEKLNINEKEEIDVTEKGNVEDELCPAHNAPHAGVDEDGMSDGLSSRFRKTETQDGDEEPQLSETCLRRRVKRVPCQDCECGGEREGKTEEEYLAAKFNLKPMTVALTRLDRDSVRVGLDRLGGAREKTDKIKVVGTALNDEIGVQAESHVGLTAQDEVEETSAENNATITELDDVSEATTEGDRPTTMTSGQEQFQHQINRHHLSVQKGGGDCPDVEMKGVETLNDGSDDNKDIEGSKTKDKHEETSVDRNETMVHGSGQLEPQNVNGVEMFAHESKLHEGGVESVENKHKQGAVKDMEIGNEGSDIKHEHSAGKVEVEVASSSVQRESREKYTPDKTVSEKKRTKERLSPTSFLDFADDGDDDDDDDESDDDLLGTAPAFLKSIERLTGRPSPKTPEKPVFSSSQSSGVSDVNDVSMEYHSPLEPRRRPLPHGRSKFTLDHLLADHMDNFEHDAEMDEIKSELQAGIQEGGFVNILNKEEEATTDLPLPDAQQEVLRHFHVEESHICDFRPGVEVFCPRNHLCLFDATICPANCEFSVVGSTHLEKRLATVVPEQYQRLLSTSVIPLLFHKLPCQAALLRWLFYLMSVERHHLTRDGCQTVLQEVLHKHHTTVTCFPGVYDLISVLVNYGAQLETLVPSDLVSVETVRSRLYHKAGYQPVAGSQGGGDGAQLRGFQNTNLFMVLDYLALTLYRNSVTMTADELDLLLVVLCKASLDSSFKSSCGVEAFSKCIALTVRQYTEEDWQTHRCGLCGVLLRLSEHHHDMASLAELLPQTGARGMYLQRTVGFLMLVRLILDDDTANEEGLGEVQIRDLHIMVAPMKELLIEDPYKLSSVVTILNICVGINTTLKATEREELKTLIELVHSIRVRDNVGMLDRTRVKDMMVRLTSSWSLDIQTMKGKQTKIFEYAVHDSPVKMKTKIFEYAVHDSPVKMKIEAVETSQVEEDSASDSQSDDDEMPHKIQKLLPPGEDVT